MHTSWNDTGDMPIQVQINSTRITHKLIRYVRVREREQESEEAEKYNNHRPGFVEVFE